MNVILRALSHPEIGDIPIEDSLFVVGRQEPPFNAHNGETVAKLSRRHARIFEQDGHYFLADAGSLNGTRLNGQPLGTRAARLRQGDEISFADQLRFRVELPMQEAPASDEADVELSLIPCDADTGLDILVISRFPFLISQTEGAFARYRDSHGDALSHLSRRHAHIFLNRGRLHIEDLGSTNGTRLGDRPLDEHPRPLQNGDEVTFGCPTFRYRVEVAERDQPGPNGNTVAAPPRAAPPQPPGDPAADAGAVSAPAEPKTTFITSASPFLDIFCQQPEPARERDQAAVDEPAPSPSAPKGRLSRIGYFVGELRRALGLGGKPASPTRRLAGLGVVALLAAAALLLYQRDADERALKTLIGEARYAEAEHQAARYLQSHPDNLEVQALANEALLKTRVPDWQSQLDRHDYPSARQRLEPGVAVHPQGLDLLALLGWITDLEQYYAERAGTAGLELYRDEPRLSVLLAGWEGLGRDARQLMDLIRERVPSFSPLHTRVFSQLRQLEYESSVYLAAIESLNQDLQRLLADGRTDDVAARLADFGEQYPSIRGLERLKQDLADYRRLEQAISRRDLDALADAKSRLGFRTPPFQLQAEQHLRQQLPPDQIIDTRLEAQRAWRDGDAPKAIALLETQLSHPWGDALESQLAHYRSVDSDYRRLQGDSGSPASGPALIAFYGGLDPDQDRYYLEALRPAFQHHAEEALRNADAALRAAGQSWQEYQQQGGIGSSLRLEADISERFRQQARRLTRARAQASQGIRLYGLLEQSPAEPSLSLEQRIATELEGQRQWLQDLNTVLDPPLLRAKLQLLAPETMP